MKRREEEQSHETVGKVNINDNLRDERKSKIAVSVSVLVAFIAVIMLISNIVSTNKSLDKIIYNAKVEAENMLLASGKMIYKEDAEQYVDLNNVRALSNENLPENTTENPQEIGTQVAPKANWNIETVKAMSVGNGDTVPVPIGFYYVGGDLNTGVIISDNEEDKYDGITDKTTYEYTTQLKGNQFVWIPCKEEEYKKCEVWNGIIQKSGTLANSAWDRTTYTAELPQIRKYEGFYVGRYEAGLANTIQEFTSTQQSTGSSQVYNLEGKPQAKAGIIPWNFIDWTTSQKNAKNMYNTESVSSGLITGTQWDVMLNKMVEKGTIESGDLTDSANWGNHMNNSIEYTGRMAREWISSRFWYMGAFGEKTASKTTSYSSDNGDLLTTGASKQTEKYHLYDAAGNLWEWTDECSTYSSSAQYCIIRGGLCIGSSSAYPACYRNGGRTVSDNDLGIGFRVVLYIK